MRRDLLWPLLLIISALVLTGIVAYFVVASEEDDPAAALFNFRADDDKLTNFGIFKDAIIEGSGTHPSFVVELNLGLLERSIEKNTGMPAGGRMQKYNYAVTDTGIIVVAVWTEQERYDHLFEPKPDPGHCDRDERWPIPETPPTMQPSRGALQLVMINIYPEFQNTKVSPCWVMLPSRKPMGLLDGSSKHLMLAQGPRMSLEDFVEAWRDAKVQGAGEIVVNFRGESCAYTITDSSGTYKPNDLDNLKSVAFTFARSLRKVNGDPVPPEYIVDKDEGLMRFDKHSTLRGNEDTGALSCL